MYWLIVVTGVSYFLLTLYSYIMPEWLSNVASFAAFGLLVLILLLTTVIGFTKWRNLSRLWMMPALVCLAFILSAFLTPPMGRAIADWNFKRHATEYLKIVDGVKSGAISCGPQCDARLQVFKAANTPANIRALMGARCDDGEVVVAFLIGTDVPLLHEGYFFKDYEDTNPCIKDAMRPDKKWAYVRPVAGKWYHFSDQPGL
jgi:hypothetical protein